MTRRVFASPASISQDLAASFKRTIFSYRRLSDWEARDAKPFQLRMHQVRPGDSVSRLSESLPYQELREERLRTLNGLAPNQGPAVGSWIKLIGIRSQ